MKTIIDKTKLFNDLKNLKTFFDNSDNHYPKEYFAFLNVLNHVKNTLSTENKKDLENFLNK